MRTTLPVSIEHGHHPAHPTVNHTLVSLLVGVALLSGCNPPTPTVTGIAPVPVSTPTTEESPGTTSAPSLAPIGPPVDALVIDGERVEVHWPDGDSLDIDSGSLRGHDARIEGFNTLEGYGAVQQWGEWTYAGLADTAAASKALARSQAWECERLDDQGGYGRLLLRCPELQAAMLRYGLGHAFTIDTPIPQSALAAQREAQEAGRGIWARGVPEAVVTSVTSTEDGNRRTFDRYVDTRTGQAERAFHERAYAPCEEVCHFGSCMRYLPHDRRFGPNRRTCP